MDRFGSVAIISGDFLNVLDKIPPASIDLIYTDPPYAKEYRYVYKELAKCATRILKPGGSLVSIVPHWSLHIVLNEVGIYLRYRWIHAMWQQSGPHARLAMGIEVIWKPIVWWTNGPAKPPSGFVIDGFDNDSKPKDSHKWEQSESWARYGLKFLPEGGVALDPMMGTGTFLKVCQQQGIQAIGVEQDPEMYARAIGKLNLTAS